MKPDTKFEQIDLPRKEFAGEKGMRYRIYKDADNFVVAEGQTAKQALDASGISQAYKIELDNRDLNRVLDKDVWAQKAPAETTAAQPAADAKTEAAPATPVPEPSTPA